MLRHALSSFARKGFFPLCFLTMISPAALAQPSPAGTAEGDIPSFLNALVSHNPQLSAAQRANAALVADRRAENRPGQTSVEYSPFYQSGYTGVASSELIVQQELDFPTLYATRSHTTTALQQMLDAQYATQRRDVLLQAVTTLLDLCASNQRLDLLRRRQAAADSLLTTYERRLAEGDATRIDVNRIRLDQMTTRTELLRATDIREAQILELVHLNGGWPLADDITHCADPERLTAGMPWATDALPDGASAFPASHEVRQADAAVQLSRHELSEARQAWLPQLSVGYRRNTERSEALNGFLVGVSLPIFGNKNKVKAARLRSEAADYALDEAMAAFDAEQQTLQRRHGQLQLMLETYDEALMQEQLTLLHRAVNAGELSVTDYYNEADRIYALLLDHLDLQTEYYQLRARLYRDSL